MAYRRQYIGDFRRSQREHPSWPVVISEGDSWFSYSDMIGRLDDPRGTAKPADQRRWSLLRLEKAGDEVLTILSGSQRSRLRDLLERWKLDALLFSGGGNDIIGPDLPPLLRDWAPGMTAEDAVARSRFERRLRQIADCYRELLDLMADAGQTARIFVNSYDYVGTNEKPARILFGRIRIAGPWLKPAFDARGIPGAERPAIVRLLIDAFAATIDQVAAEPRGVGRLVRVETRGVVGSRFKDEIHPDPSGARLAARAFGKALRDAGVLH